MAKISTNGEFKRDPIDAAVGMNVKARRASIGISQTTLANHLGITFQQVQKYEKGTNRIGASRLFRIAAFLKTTVTKLYNGVTLDDDTADLDEATQRIMDYQVKPQCHDLIDAVSRIEGVTQRTRLVQLAKSMAAAGEAA